MSRAAISLIQTGLRDLGHDPGKIDGLWGARTAAALQALLAAGGQRPGVALKPVTSAIIVHGAVPVDEIVVHCAATRPEWMQGSTIAAKRSEIERWHRARGWNGIGYHWIVDRDGKIVAGRPENVVGAHVEGHNSGKLGVCLIGGHGSDADDDFGEHFTAAQDMALRQLIQAIGMRTPIRRVSGHNEYANRACPGFNVPAWLNGAA